MALQRLGQLEEAVAELEVAARLDPGDAGSRYNRALALDLLGRTEEAIAGYRDALAVDPRLLDAALNLGGAMTRIDDPAGARRAYRRALEIDPGSATARHMVAALTGQTTDSAPADYVREVFDSAAASFDEHLAALEYKTPAALAALIADLGGGGRVLDLGCGTGLFGAEVRAAADLLVGVDLSAEMLARARARGDYDELVRGDALEFLAGDERRWDLVAAADVLVYLGDLEPLLRLARSRLAGGGLVAFSVERVGGGGWSLQPSGRFAHDPAYVAGVAGRCGLREVARTDVELRRERGRPVPGALFALAPAGDS